MEFSDIDDLNRFSYDIPAQMITCGRHHVHLLAQKVMPLAQLSLSDVYFGYNQSSPICRVEGEKVLNGFSMLYFVKGESFRLFCDAATHEVIDETVLERKLRELSLEMIRSMATLAASRFSPRIAKDIKVIEICESGTALKLRLKNKMIDCDVEHRKEADALFLRPYEMTKKRPFPEMQ